MKNRENKLRNVPKVKHEGTKDRWGEMCILLGHCRGSNPGDQHHKQRPQFHG